MARTQQSDSDPRGEGLGTAALVRSGVFYGWWVLLALALMRVMASGVGNQVRSLLVLPFEEEFEVTRAEVSLMFTAGSIAVALTGPLGGWLMDRFGPRKVMIVTTAMSISGYVFLSISDEFWQALVIFTIPLGVAYNWAILNSGAPILNNWFERGKARALSLLNVGHGAGALLLPLMALAIVTFEWRASMVLAAVVMTLVMIPVLFVVRNTPEEMGLSPDGDEPDPTRAATGGRPAQQAGMTLAEAIRGPFFWAVGIGSSCMLFVNSGIIAHIVPLLVWKGQSEGMGALLLSLQLVWTVPVVLGVSWAADRYDGSRIMVGMMLVVLAGAITLLVAQSLWSLTIAVMMLATGGSHWAIFWAVLGRQYGRAHYNSIRLCIYSIIISGIAGAPFFAGLTFDRTGSYEPWLQIILVVGLVGLVSFIVAAVTRKERPAWMTRPAE
ncbi:MAG: MFS transporter [Chloroflexota bacterium]|nr:MFS transporter [Chloroflexota bacterium]